MNVANSTREIVNQTLAKLSPKLSKNDEKRLISQLEEQYLDGLITEEERYQATVRIWTEANDDLTAVIAKDNTDRNKRDVMSGENKVCIQTIRNLNTSFL